MSLIPHFVTTGAEHATALRSAFQEWTDVQVHECRFEEIDGNYPAFVTAGNSFGIMDGGIDLAVREYWGAEIQLEVQRQIRLQHAGLCPVGSTVTVTAGGIWLIYAPTMIVPAPVPATLNAYQAMKAALRAASNLELSHILVPALAAGVGQMPPQRMAWQMAEAFRHFLQPPVLPDWTAQRSLWQRLLTGGEPTSPQAAGA